MEKEYEIFRSKDYKCPRCLQYVPGKKFYYQGIKGFNICMICYGKFFYLKAYAINRICIQINSGEISRPVECLRCGRYGVIDFYHEDLDLPFKILWLCGECAGERDRSLEIQIRGNCTIGEAI